MARHIRQTTTPQYVDVTTYQDIGNMDLHRQMYAGPIIHSVQMHGETLSLKQCFCEYLNAHHSQFCRDNQQYAQFDRDLQQRAQFYNDLQQHAQYYRDLQQHVQFYRHLPQHAEIYRNKGIQQHAIYREVNQEKQPPPPQPTTQAHVCDKSKIHSPRHTGKMTYKCDVCHKCFTWNCLLQKHYLTHTGEKPHVCDVCNKGFSRKVYLKKHSVIHTGQKPHECDICRRRFTFKRSLTLHYSRHTGEKNYICEICNKGFYHKTYLRLHLRYCTLQIGKVRRKKNGKEKC